MICKNPDCDKTRRADEIFCLSCSKWISRRQGEFFNSHDEYVGAFCEDYIDAKCIKLDNKYSNFEKIYLDSNFWIALSDAKLKQSSIQWHYDLLEVCLNLFNTGRCIFPISQSVFDEITNTNDEIALTARLEMIDLLSEGLAFASRKKRIEWDFKTFIRKKVNSYEGDAAFKEKVVWTKICFARGDMIFSELLIELSNLDDELAIMSEVNKYWESPMSDLVKTSHYHSMCSNQFHSQFSESFDELWAEWHMERKKSYLQGYTKNKKNIFADSFAGEFYDRLWMNRDLMNASYDEIQSVIKVRDVEEVEKLTEYRFREICDHLRSEHLLSDFPSIVAEAALHAAHMCQPNRKYRPNDQNDFLHVVSALFHCNILFTDGPLKNLLKTMRSDKVQKNGERSGCAVFGADEPEKGIEYLKEELGKLSA